MGNPNCCAQCFRLLFVAVNALFLIIGLALVGVGIYTFVSIDQYGINGMIPKAHITSGGIILIVSGLVTAVVSGIGFVGACLKWRPLLVIYIIILTIIVLLEIAAGVIALVFKDKLDTQSRSTYAEVWNNAIDKYNTSDSDTKSTIDSIQKYFKCCGSENYTSWIEEDLPIPDSCGCSSGSDCEQVSYDVNGQNVTQNVFKMGCIDATLDYAQKMEYVVGGVGVAFGIFEIIGVMIAIGLIIWISKGSSDGYQVV